MKKYRVRVNGREYLVEIEEILNDDSDTVAINSYVPESRVVDDYVSAGEEERWVKAPLPGQILSVPVQLDEQVLEGDVLVVLEAMKMENEILSPATGRVTLINVQESDTVKKGDRLIYVEKQ